MYDKSKMQKSLKKSKLRSFVVGVDKAFHILTAFALKVLTCQMFLICDLVSLTASLCQMHVLCWAHPLPSEKDWEQESFAVLFASLSLLNIYRKV